MQPPNHHTIHGVTLTIANGQLLVGFDDFEANWQFSFEIMWKICCIQIPPVTNNAFSD